MSKVCINVAWPYSNGAIHLGHLAGSLLPQDIFSRYNRIIGNEVLMVGGSDQHGTPITLSAEKCGMTPENYADNFHEINKKAIEDMEIQYSLFSKTHNQNHFDVVQNVFLDLYSKDYIYSGETEQYYCPKCDHFLPDRYVEGICPKCSAKKARSDQCDVCGTTFEPGDLIDPYCILCGSKPDIHSTKHFFFRLSAFRERLMKFIEKMDNQRPNVKSFTRNWLQNDLHDRAITRDMSWGIPIPIQGWNDKVIYVWFEAVIGYLSTSIEYSKLIGKPNLWEDFWMDPTVKHYYFIGKDNIPFHSIIWPAMLMAMGNLNLPYNIPANEYLMIGGGKLSKSRGGAIDVPSILHKYDADVIRYYLSSIMPDTHDSEFSWEDFQTKVNNELVANIGNYYHRCLSFTKKNFGVIPDPDIGPEYDEISEKIRCALLEYKICLQSCDFKKGIGVVMNLAHFGNRYFDSIKPWNLIKIDKKACGMAMNSNLRIVRSLCIMAWPFMPKTSENIWTYLGYKEKLEDINLNSILDSLPIGQNICEPKPVYKKVELYVKNIDNMSPNCDKLCSSSGASTDRDPFAEFKKMDIRIGQVISVENHSNAEKLYVLKVDIGEDQPRQIVTNLKSCYSPDQMIGRKLLVISNLKPAKFRGVRSEGMLMAADDRPIGGKTILILKPSIDVPCGTKVNCGMQNSSSRIDIEQCSKVKMYLSTVKGGKFMGMDISLPEGSPSIVVAIVNNGKTIVLGDGKRCVITVDAPIMDGAYIT